MRRRHVAIVGGGIAGLAAALALNDAFDGDVTLTIIEQSDRLGGKLRTGMIDGRRVETGAETFLAREADDPNGGPSAAVELARRVGLGPTLIHPQTTAAAVFAAGEFRPMPAGTLMGVPADVSTWPGIAGAALAADTDHDDGRPILAAGEDASVGAVVRRRFGDAIVDDLVDPMLGGVYAGRADDLSIAVTMPGLAAACRAEHTLQQAVRATLARRVTADDRPWPADGPIGSDPIGSAPVDTAPSAPLGSASAAVTSTVGLDGAEVVGGAGGVGAASGVGARGGGARGVGAAGGVGASGGGAAGGAGARGGGASGGVRVVRGAGPAAAARGGSAGASAALASIGPAARRAANVGPAFATVDGGLSRLVAAIDKALPSATVLLGHPVRNIARSNGGWRLMYGSTHDAHTLDVDAVVLAVPSHPAARLLAPFGGGAADAVGALDYASLALVTMLLPPQALAGTPLDERSGGLVPAASGHAVKAVTVFSTKWAGQPDGAVLLRASLGRYGDEQVLQMPDKGLADLAYSDLVKMLGRPLPAPWHAAVTRWGGALPQYAPGHLDRVASARAALPPTIALAG
ncbi:MAG TPA: FAD-dependent oxidoreductase, partial [Micromonosporaceae bacterium]